MRKVLTQNVDERQRKKVHATENSGLEQVVNFPTRDNNLLDIFATNRPTLVQSCKPIPGVSDHETVCVTSDISAKYQRHMTLVKSRSNRS